MLVPNPRKAEKALTPRADFPKMEVLTLIAAANLEETDAGVCFYGIPPAEAANPANIKVPLLCHFANQDDWCTPEAVHALELSDRLDDDRARAASHYHLGVAYWYTSKVEDALELFSDRPLLADSGQPPSSSYTVR